MIFFAINKEHVFFNHIQEGETNMKKSETFNVGNINGFIFRQFLKCMDNPLRERGNSSAVSAVSASNIFPGSTVLEIGCGSGFFTAEISRQAGPHGKLVSIDIHPEAVAMTLQKTEKESLTNTAVLCRNAEVTGFENNTFDTVCIYGVIPSPFISTHRLIREMHRILKEKGTIAIWCGPFRLNTASIEHEGLFRQRKIESGVFLFEKNLQ